jgi:hypothetical protein
MRAFIKKILRKMKRETKQTDNSNKIISPEEKINRKEAMIKASKYAAFTALGMMVLLSPKKSQAQSGSPGSPGGSPGMWP